MNIRKTFYISLMTISLAWYGCTVADETDDPSSDPTRSSIVFKLVPSAVGSGVDTLVLKGDKVQWYNATTKEVRFTDNYAVAQSIPFASYQSVKFYLRTSYLFSSFLATSSNSQIVSSLVFYYSSTENRFYLKDGYPDVSVLSNPEAEQQLRDENRKKIADEWALFINQLKLEGRYLE